ncbi:MAG: hypothetical protein F2825_03930, partial [Actinobacteria bacterium]|nr:hypothetical protein [Actinomycetota bacterium]
MSGFRRPAHLSRTAGRVLTVAGLGVGLWLAGQAAASASAEEPAAGTLLSGITTPVADLVGQVAAPVSQVVAPVTTPVAQVLAPVTTPVAQVVAP